MKHNNICNTGIPEESEQRTKNLSEEIRIRNFPNPVKEKDIQVQEAQRVPNKLDLKRPTPRHIMTKMTRLKDKERIRKTTREKQILTYKGAPIRLASDYSTERCQARKEYYEIFKVI